MMPNKIVAVATQLKALPKKFCTVLNRIRTLQNIMLALFSLIILVRVLVAFFAHSSNVVRVNNWRKGISVIFLFSRMLFSAIALILASLAY